MRSPEQIAPHHETGVVVVPGVPPATAITALRATTGAMAVRPADSKNRLVAAPRAGAAS